METNQFKTAKVIGFLINLVFTITAFIMYSFRDALVIVFILNALLALAAIVCSIVPIIGQVGFWILCKKLLLPLFFTQWFPEISQTIYVDSVFILFLVSSASMSLFILLVAIRHPAVKPTSEYDTYY